MAETAGQQATFATLIRAITAGQLASARVMLPARVTAWDAAHCRVDAQPLLKEGGVVLPVIPAVPVIFPGAGGFRVTFPLKVGDTVALVFSDRSLDEWLASDGSAPVDVADPRAHHLTDAVAIPGLHPWSEAWAGVDSSVMTVGKDGATAHTVGLGDRIRTELDALWDAVTLHTHAVAGVTAGPATVTTAVESTHVKVAQTVASSTVKVTE